MRQGEIVSGMQVFGTAVRGGSFAEAARRHGLSPSAVSKLIDRLERRLGVRLLSRSTRRMTLTEAGCVFFERARVILDDLQRLEQDIASDAAGLRGMVRVTLPQLLGQRLVLPIVLRFLHRAPAVSLECDISDRHVDMIGDRIDIAVRIGIALPPAFVARRVGVIARVLCASADYLARHPPPRHPADLRDHSCMLLSGPATATTWYFRRRADVASPQSLRIVPRLRMSSSVALHEATLAGLGIAELPFYLAAEDIRAARLVRVLAEFEPLERDVFVICPRARMAPSRVTDLARFLRAELQLALRALPAP